MRCHPSAGLAPLARTSCVPRCLGGRAVLDAATRSPSRPPRRRTRGSRAGDVLLGRLPVREPVATYGPFVMNTRGEPQQAVNDYRAGRLGVIPANALMPHVVR